MARIAQVVEHSLGKGEVPSSTLGVSTTTIEFGGKGTISLPPDKATSYR